MPNAVTVLGKEFKEGHLQVTVRFSHGKNEVTETLRCPYPYEENWLEKACVERLEWLLTMNKVHGAVKPGPLNLKVVATKDTPLVSSLLKTLDV